MRYFGLLVCAACSIVPDYRESRFACVDEQCPDGFRCDRKIAACTPDEPATCGGPAAIRTSFDAMPAWLAPDPTVVADGGRLVLSVPPNGGVGAGSRRPLETFDLTRGALVIRGISPPAPESAVYLNLWSRDVYRGIRIGSLAGATRLALYDFGGAELAGIDITALGSIDVRVRTEDGRFALDVGEGGGAWRPWARREDSELSLEYMNLEMFAGTVAATPSTMSIDEVSSDVESDACQPSDGFADMFRQTGLDGQWTDGSPCMTSIADGGLELRGPAGAECVVGLRRIVDLRNQVVGIVRAPARGPSLLRLEIGVGAQQVAVVVAASATGSELSATTCGGGACTDRRMPDLGEPWLGMAFVPEGATTTVSFVAGPREGAMERVLATLQLPFGVAQARLAISARIEAADVVPRVEAFTAQRSQR